MKSINYFFAVAAFVFTATSCVESSGKYKAVVADRDSLRVVGEQYLATLDILNDVENGFTTIREKENNIVLKISGNDGKPATKKQEIRAQMDQINEILENNKSKIAELEQRLEKEGKSNRSLSSTIKRLQNELAERSALVESLQYQLSQKNVEISQLADLISVLKTDLSVSDSINNDQKGEIASLDKEVHKRWYCVGKKKDLKERNIVEGSGLFGTKTKVNQNFNNASFNEVDMRDLTSINTNSSSPKLLSVHPEGSYTFVTNGDKSVTLKITDNSLFWNNTKYLVIQQ